jgi:hypothetical protein
VKLFGLPIEGMIFPVKVCFFSVKLSGFSGEGFRISSEGV